MKLTHGHGGFPYFTVKYYSFIPFFLQPLCTTKVGHHITSKFKPDQRVSWLDKYICTEEQKEEKVVPFGANIQNPNSLKKNTKTKTPHIKSKYHTTPKGEWQIYVLEK